MNFLVLHKSFLNELLQEKGEKGIDGRDGRDGKPGPPGLPGYTGKNLGQPQLFYRQIRNCLNLWLLSDKLIE